MRYHAIITEHPQLIPPTDFDLGDPIKNRSMRAVFSTGTPEVLIDDPAFQVILVGYAESGKIGLIERQGGWMAYFVEYELVDAFVGRSVTQVTLWRDNTSAFVQGITRRMFYEVLLHRFHTIMSDGQQTKDGREFWVSRMAEAAQRKLRVGLADLRSKQIEWLAPNAEFRAWIGRSDGWGTSPDYQDKRFVISQ